MNRIRLALLCVLSPLLLVACGKKKNTNEGTGKGKDLRVLGYLFADNWLTGLTSIDLGSITDLNLAFVNPDATGKMPVDDVYRQVVEKAHEQKVRVFFSIGGGDPPAYLAGLMEENSRAAFIAELLAFAQRYQFDGVDVDLENALINANYAPFVVDLAKVMKPANKLMMAALASWNGNQVSDEALRSYDFINIMSYDKTGPWNTGNPGQHSPFSMAEDDLKYYSITRGIPANKLLVGLPFYGYGFGNGAPSGMTYKDIVATYPGADQVDEVTVPGGGTIYYNGIPTIRRKVEMAISNGAAGVMIWHLRGDASGPSSLLKVINDAKKK